MTPHQTPSAHRPATSATTRASGLDRTLRLLTIGLQVIYAVVPILYFSWWFSHQNAEQEQRLAAHQQGREANLQAFSSYCKDRQRVIHRRAPQPGGASVFIRHEADHRTGVSAYGLHKRLNRPRSSCPQLGIRYLEEVFTVQRYDGHGTIRETEVRRHAACTEDKWTVIPQIEARYELVFGAMQDKSPVPWGDPERTWMSKRPIRILDRETGELLAEDMMYQLRYESGEGSCPSSMEQTYSLLKDVFGEQ